MSQEDYILVFEDDVDQQALITLHLSKMGYKSRCFATVEASNKAIAEHTPIMIILDLLLPDRPGMLVLQDLMDDEKTKEIPVIVATSFTDDEIIVAALSSGATDVIIKPYRFSYLLPRIQKAFEISKYQHQLKIANLKLEKEKLGMSRYFPDDVLQRIVAGELEPELGGKYQVATILFMDLRGSTGLGEDLTAENFVELLNTFFGDVFDIVFGIGGSVNKMLGDGMLATFGVPIHIDDAAVKAAKVAIHIKRHLDLFNEFKPDFLTKDLGLGVGIATGRIFAGNIGTHRLMEYAVLGDPVNLAARLENLNKRYETSILIDKNTQDELGPEFKTTFLGKVQVKGKQEHTEIFSLDSMD